MAGFFFSWKDVKGTGNQALGHGDYELATEHYNHAIFLAESCGAGLREISALYSNRSFSLSKLGHIQQALQDAFHCIDLNRKWCKGYWRAGQALKLLKKSQEALQAFSDGCALVNEDDGKNFHTKVDFIVEIVSLSHEIGSWIYLATHVRARDNVWSQVLLRMAKEKKWETLLILLMGTGVFRKESVMFNYQGKFPKISTQKICLTNLIKYCASQADPRFVHLAINLLQHGSKETDITLETGDTPFHAALRIAVRTSNTDLLWHLVNSNPDRVKAVQDARGDTLLHKMAKALAREQSIFFGEVTFELMEKIDSSIRNKEGKLAIDYIPKGSALYGELDKRMRQSTSKGRKGEQWGRPATDTNRKTDLKPSPQPPQPHFGQTDFKGARPKDTQTVHKVDGGGDGKKSQQYGKPASGGKKKVKQKPGVQQSFGPESPGGQPDSYSKGARPKDIHVVHKVDEGGDGNTEQPVDLFQRGKECLAQLEFEKALGSLCKFLEENSSASKLNAKASEALDIVVDKIVPTFKEIPSRISCKLPEKIWTQVIKQLTKSGKWQTVQKLLLGGGNGHEKGQGGLADNCSTAGISIAHFLGSHDERDVSVHKYDLVTALLKHGCSPDGVGSDKIKPLSHSLQSEDMKMVMLLLREGANPTPLSLSSNDTPLHVALSNGMKAKGDFSLLEQLFKLYSTCPEKYPMLEPSSVDGTGNTLFHVIAKGTCSPHAVNAARILLQNKVNPLVRNKDGSTAMQMLKKGNDRRMQYMKQAKQFYPDFSPPTPRKKKGKQKENEKSAVLPADDEVTANEALDTAQKDITCGQDTAQTDITPHLLKKEGTTSIVPKMNKEDTRKRISSLISDLPQMEPKRWKDDSASMLLSSAASVKDGQAKVEQGVYNENSGVGKTAVIEEDEIQNDLETDLQENKLEEEPQDVDPSLFDDLVWEVECTANLWKLLREKKLEIKMKRRIIEKIQFLGNGHWRQDLCKRLEGAAKNAGMMLYEAKLTKGARILWELAIAFSPRCSESAEQRLGMEPIKEGVVGGRIYSEVIRVWDVVFDHDNVSRKIDSIVTSFNRGQECIIQKKLKGMERKDFPSNKFTEQRIPMYFHEVDTEEKEPPNPLPHMPKPESSTKFFPPASANETEYHIMKFYSFTSALVNNVLLNQDTKVDFPFRVTELEHAIINLNPKPPQSILLLGRSGTGKTTCCLYRLWTFFSRYWEQAARAGEPLIPRSVTFVHQDVKADKLKNKDTSEMSDFGDDGDDDDDDDDDVSADESEKLDVASKGATCNTEDCQQELGNTQEAPIMEHLHQVFVTKNAVLCSEVKRNFRELSHAWEPANAHVEVEDLPLPNCLQEAHPAQFPLFITAKQWLMLLDGSLPNSFFPRNQDGSLKRHIQGWGEKEASVTYIPDLDDSDGELEDDEDDTVLPGDPENEDVTNQPQPKETDPRREVTYEVFACELWTKVNKEKIDYHPTLVWMEIMSFIKGSVEALHTEKGELSREGYLELGQKRAPNFSGDRNKVYDMFERYRQIKLTKGLFDECDVISHIYRRLKDIKVLQWSLHQIYVDETQDFTQGELSLFIRCCQDPNSLFLTGDTAQSIMRGVAFRFDDLKTLFHYASKSFKAVGKTSAVAVPKKVYQLTHNYRSHAGILDLASSVIDLLVKFFPESFDRLERDQGLFLGPKPVLLQSCSFSDLALLLRGNKRKTSEIEFGAHQVILVANEEAKSNLPEELSLALVLTIYESKGLEFDDVLLYNFFKDSPAYKEWRVVTGHLDKQYKYNQEKGQDNLVELDIDEEYDNVRPRPLDFSPEKHKVLNSELKYLYTALTRARVNVWIFDQDEEKRAPMFEYFVRRRLMDVVETRSDSSDDGLSSAMFACTSTAEEWVKRGDYFYNHKLYQVAAKCYRRGGEEVLERMSLAQARALSAERLRENPHKLKQEFLLASEEFLQCSMPSEAAKCLYNAKEFLLAARLFEKMAKFRDAAVLYKKVKYYQDAANCYEQSSDFRKAIEIHVSVDQFQKAADVRERYDIKAQEYMSHGKMLPQALINGAPSPLHSMDYLCFEAAKLHFHRREYDAMNAALSRLPFERQLQFLKERNNIAGVAALYKRNGQSMEAAKFLKSKGKVEEALEYAERLDDPHFRAECLMISSRMKLQNMSSPTIKQNILKNLEEAEKLFSACEDSNGQAEAQLYLAKLRKDIKLLKISSDLFKKNHNIGGQVEVVEVLMEIVPELLPIHVLPVRDAVESVANFLLIVPKSPVKHTQTERAMLDICELYYGIEKGDREQVRKVKTSEAARIDLLLTEDLDKDQVPKNLVHEKMCQDLLKKVGNGINKCRAMMWSHMKKQEICPDFIAGQPCQELGSCSKLRQEPKRDHLLHHLDSILRLIHLDSTVEWACEQPHKDTIKRQLEDLRPRKELGGRFGSCLALYKLLFPAQGHHRNLCSLPVEAREVMNRIRSLAVEDQLKRWAKYEWTKCPQDQLSNTDLFLLIFNVQRLLKVKIEVLKGMLTKTADGYSAEASKKVAPHKVPKDIGMVYVGERGNRHMFISLMSRFIDFSKELHSKLDPITAMRALVLNFIRKLADRATEPLMPSIANTVWMMELATTLFLSMVAKTTPGVVLCLPSGYLAQLSLYDFIRDGEYAMWMSLTHCTWPREWYPVVARMMVTMVKILCGNHNPKFNVIEDAFSSVAYIRSGETERTLVLMLTLLCNTNQALPPDCEVLIRRSLNSIRLDREILPQRLYLRVKAAKEANGLQGIVEVLQEALRHRDQCLYQCVWGAIGKKSSTAKGLVNHPVRPASFSPTYNMPLTDVQATANSYSDTGKEVEIYGEEMEEFDEQEILDAEKSAKRLEMEKKLVVCLLVIRACRKFNQLRQVPNQAASASTKDNRLPNLIQHITIDNTMCGYCGVYFSSAPTTQDWEEEKEENQASQQMRSVSPIPTDDTASSPMPNVSPQPYLYQSQLSWEPTKSTDTQFASLDEAGHLSGSAQPTHIFSPIEEQAKQRNSHEKTRDHFEKMQYFGIFHTVYVKQVLPLLQKCEDFEQQLPCEDEHNAEALLFKLHGLAISIMHLKNTVNNVVQLKTWGSTREVIHQAEEVAKQLRAGMPIFKEWQREAEAEKHRVAVAQEKAAEAMDEEIVIAHDEDENQVGHLLTVAEGPGDQRQMKKNKRKMKGKRSRQN